MNRRRLVERTFLLPWAGAFLLTPPVIGIVQTWGKVSGWPVFLVYIFAVWFVLILLGGLLSWRLARIEDAGATDPGAAGDDGEGPG